MGAECCIFNVERNETSKRRFDWRRLQQAHVLIFCRKSFGVELFISNVGRGVTPYRGRFDWRGSQDAARYGSRGL